MKKNRVKSMESPSIRIYEELMQKKLLNNLCWIWALSVFLLGGVTSASNHPSFLILKDGIDMNTEVASLEAMGGVIRDKIPPQIIIADLPDSIHIGMLSTVKTIYSSPISLSSLEPYGPLGVAAGTEWNRQLLRDTQTMNRSSLGAMRVMVAQQSLPAPQDFSAENNEQKIHCSWSALNGALYYELQMSHDPSFSNILTQTIVNRLEVDVPLIDPSPLYLRVRGADHIKDENQNENDVFGQWSKSVSLQEEATPKDETATAPTLTSPLSGYQSRGFNLILEWLSNDGDNHRIQVSRTAGFDNLIVDDVINGRLFVCPSQVLHVGDSLYWRVKVWGAKTSPWSTVNTLEVGAPHQVSTDMMINPESPK